MFKTSHLITTLTYNLFRNEVVSRGYKIPHENEVLVLKGEPGDPGEMGLQGR